jgi:hypothetical protein
MAVHNSCCRSCGGCVAEGLGQDCSAIPGVVSFRVPLRFVIDSSRMKYPASIPAASSTLVLHHGILSSTAQRAIPMMKSCPRTACRVRWKPSKGVVEHLVLVDGHSSWIHCECLLSALIIPDALYPSTCNCPPLRNANPSQLLSCGTRASSVAHCG